MATKKKVVKRLRLIANHLPVVKAKTFKKEIIKNFFGAPVAERKIPTTIVVNHTRRMKKLFKKFGLAGVQSYIAAVGNLKEHII